MNIVLKEASHTQKVNSTILPRVSTSVRIPIFEIPAYELDRIAYLKKDRVRQ